MLIFFKDSEKNFNPFSPQFLLKKFFFSFSYLKGRERAAIYWVTWQRSIIGAAVPCLAQPACRSNLSHVGDPAPAWYVVAKNLEWEKLNQGTVISNVDIPSDQIPATSRGI